MFHYQNQPCRNQWHASLPLVCDFFFPLSACKWWQTSYKGLSALCGSEQFLQEASTWPINAPNQSAAVRASETLKKVTSVITPPDSQKKTLWRSEVLKGKHHRCMCTGDGSLATVKCRLLDIVPAPHVVWLNEPKYVLVIQEGVWIMLIQGSDLHYLSRSTTKSQGLKL